MSVSDQLSCETLLPASAELRQYGASRTEGVLSESPAIPGVLSIVPAEPQQVADVADHYDELDRAYRDIWGEHVHHGYWATGKESPEEATEALIDLVADRLDLAPGLELCDIGCGYGATAERLAAGHGASVTGFTISSQQARRAAERVPSRGSLRILHRDWLDNGVPDESFDRAYAIESSEHMPDKAAFFAEAWRTLRPGGGLLVCAWLAAAEPKPWQIRHLLEPICREGRLPSMCNRQAYEALALQAGFSPVSYNDLSDKVRRTWEICARRLAARIATDPYYWRLATSRRTRNRVFLLTIPRLMLAYRTGAMRYGLFVWTKPGGRS
jgi:tocopherol O-methyltransferase